MLQIHQLQDSSMVFACRISLKSAMYACEYTQTLHTSSKKLNQQDIVMHSYMRQRFKGIFRRSSVGARYLVF